MTALSCPALDPVPHTRRPAWTAALLTAASLVLSACAPWVAAPPPTEPPHAEAATGAPTAFTLHIAHINDHHSQLAPLANTELRLNGVPTRVELGGFARQVTAFNALAGTPNLLKLHAGDAITGTLYYTFFQGEADARLMNRICFDAFIPGNHEFDDGDAALRRLLDALADPAHQGDCPGTPTLSANIEPAPGTPLAPQGQPPLLQPWTVRTVGGQRVGLVGVTTTGKLASSSRPLASTRLRPEAEAAQAAIDALQAQGVRHIVLLSHIGHDNDRALVAQLRGVDVVIGGDSHTLLGDFGAVGLRSAGPYPTVATNRDGDPVCIGQAWEYAKAYGLMRIAFDAQGRVTQCGGQARLVVGEDFQRQDASGQWRALPKADARALAAQLSTQLTTPSTSDAAIHPTPPDPEAAKILAGYTREVAAQKARPIGQAPEALCLVRVPGEATPRSGGTPGCEAANRLARGSDVAQVVAEAFLRGSPRADFALQNAGGVRVPVPAGPLSMDTAFTLLPFTNTLLEFEITGAEMAAVLEDAVARHLDSATPSDGGHPYAAGLRWTLDMRQPWGQRFQQLEVRDKATGRWQPLQPDRTYVLVTHDFIGSGKDGYDRLGRLYDAGRYVNTYRLYTQTLVDHLQALGGVLRRPAPGDYAHQRVVTRAGVVLQ